MSFAENVVCNVDRDPVRSTCPPEVVRVEEEQKDGKFSQYLFMGALRNRYARFKIEHMKYRSLFIIALLYKS